MDLTGNATLTRFSTEVETMVADPTLTIHNSGNMSLVRTTPTTSRNPTSVGDGDGEHHTIEHPTADDWEAFRPVITHHYKKEGLPVRAVREILEQKYGFIAR